MNSKYLTTVNLDPFLRNAIGVNNLFENMLNRCENVNSGNYPPYNIIRHDDNYYTIEIAVAGFDKDNIDIRVENSELVVESVGADEVNVEEPEYIHKGIAVRQFKRTWALADHVKVVDARMENGLLHISLKREVPEALKPKQIEIR